MKPPYSVKYRNIKNNNNQLTGPQERTRMEPASAYDMYGLSKAAEEITTPEKVDKETRSAWNNLSERERSPFRRAFHEHNQKTPLCPNGKCSLTELKWQRYQREQFDEITELRKKNEDATLDMDALMDDIRQLELERDQLVSRLAELEEEKQLS